MTPEYTLYEITEKRPPYTPVFVGTMSQCAKFTGMTTTQLRSQLAYQSKAKTKRTTSPYFINNIGRFKEKGKHRKRPDTEMVEIRYSRDGQEVVRLIDKELFDTIRKGAYDEGRDI